MASLSSQAVTSQPPGSRSRPSQAPSASRKRSRPLRRSKNQSGTWRSVAESPCAEGRQTISWTLQPKPTASIIPRISADTPPDLSSSITSS